MYCFQSDIEALQLLADNPLKAGRLSKWAKSSLVRRSIFSPIGSSSLLRFRRAYIAARRQDVVLLADFLEIR